ncbi:hypothetical protein SDC9_41026 [bioreactor metagenome]|uniref:Uncharacterized protein n=1 Tax=bioreactor metagenome TaxID=1076179 RepID=A0A644VU26_9ZZZZ
MFVAPGGTGKTTLLLFQVIHIVLGRDLFGHEVFAPGPVIILTAEDNRETLVARLRQMCYEMQLTGREVNSIREDVIITDVSGLGIKLTTATKDVVMPSAQLDRLVVEVGALSPSLLVIDPMMAACSRASSGGPAKRYGWGDDGGTAVVGGVEARRDSTPRPGAAPRAAANRGGSGVRGAAVPTPAQCRQLCRAAGVAAGTPALKNRSRGHGMAGKGGRRCWTPTTCRRASSVASVGGSP